jgi:hypothetical protein
VIVSEDLSKDGVWIGPRSLPVFLRDNWIFAAFWLFGLTFMAFGFWVTSGGVKSYALALPLAIATGATVTIVLMFLFSRGWIGEGE